MPLFDRAPRFERVNKATNLGLSHFVRCLPILLRAALLLLFAWYGLELYLSATLFQAKFFLVISVGVLFLAFLLILLFTYAKYPWTNDQAAPSRTTPLWPFLLMNLLMILLVAAIGKWGEDQGLLGFTQQWMHKIGGLLR